MKPKVLVIKVNGQPMTVDVASVTIRERSRALSILKADPELDHEDELTLTAAVAWVCAKRVHLDLALDDVLDSMTIGDVLEASKEDTSSPEA